MDDYVKLTLYAYPFLEEMIRGYEIHIRNGAVLSYRSNKTAEETAIYLAEEILAKRRLERLKGTVEAVLDKLSNVERLLVKIRYFGKERKMNKALMPVRENGYENWSESKYFRAQNKLLVKLQGLFASCGLSKEEFEKEYADNEIFRKAYKKLEFGADRKIRRNERGWLRFEAIKGERKGRACPTLLRKRGGGADGE